MIGASKLRSGDIILTYGEFRWWPPKYWILPFLYKAIREYQKKKWGPQADYGPTHCRVALPPTFFEMTYPVARFGNFEEIKGRYKVCRYRWPLENNGLYNAALRLEGTPYDIGDNLDFAVSGLLGWFTRNVRLFGDRAKKYVVCSTGAAQILRAGGARFTMEAIDPAYFCNSPESWEVVEEGRSS